jgi:CBS domain-containing protein
MDIQSVMTANPTCCTPDSTLREVAQLMADKDCGQIPVVDAQRRPLGVITDRDITVRAVAKGVDPATATANDFMTAPATMVTQASSLNDVVDLMEDQQIRRVLVVDDRGAVAGIVAQADIARSGGDNRTAEVVKQVSQPSTPH